MPPGAAAKLAGLELITTLKQGVKAAEGLLADARLAVAARVMRDGRPDPRALDREQRAAHGLAWLATYVEAIRQLAGYAERLMEGGGLDDTLDSIREEMRKFADDKVAPHAQAWHLNNEYIPLDVIAQMAALGVFS